MAWHELSYPSQEVLLIVLAKVKRVKVVKCD